jgi:hypothetical protein
VTQRSEDDPTERGFRPDQRSGADRRSGAQRRSGADRRGLGDVIDLALEAERRRRDDRRAERDRRTDADRRRPPGAQFSWKDTLRIQRMVVDPNREAACPRCGASLLLGPFEFREGVTTREVHCTGCRYSVAILED